MLKRLPRAIVFFIFAGLVLAGSVLGAQTATTGSVLGTVTDGSGATIPGAQLVLKNSATNLTLRQSTNANGGYVFTGVEPGTYTLTVTATGFQTRAVTGLAIEVNKSFTINPKLAVGAQTQTVEVTASSQAELQTMDATVGNVISQEGIDRLPTVQHDTVELLGLQPGVLGSGSATRVNGAIDDQNTIKLDGVDISGHVIAGANTSVESLPTPVDSVEEFRVGVANNNASFNDSSGANITLVGRRGSNDLHGAGYFYNQNQHFNANSWQSNRQNIPIQALTDNRFGARVGGPIRKNKDFFFTNYEGRRFPSTSTILRTVPTTNLRNGILTFKDASGTTNLYDLKTAANCGPSGNTACDPRGIGISPAVLKLYSEEPVGNTSNAGDGLNTTGYTAPIKTPENTDYGVVRYDHTFNTNWQLHTSATYFRDLVNSTGQVNVLNGATAAGTLDQPKRDTAFAATLVGQISPTFLNTFTFGFTRDFSVSQPLSPTNAATLEALPGTNTADGFIALQSNALNLPIDNSAGSARYQWTKDVDLQFVDDATWLVGNHTYQFGADIRSFPTTHARNDKVVAGNSSLAAVINGGTFVTIPNVDAPPTCTKALISGCLPASSTNTWDSLYATTLGLIDNVNIEAARDSSLNPLPFGTTLQGNANWQAYNFYGSDSWRATPSLTLTYGVAYGWQTPPIERNQKQVLLEVAGTGQVLTASGYLGAKAAAAATGAFYNPTLSYVPIQYTGRNVFNTDYGDVSPRLAGAWNPSFTHGLMGSLFGDRKSVIRGGMSMVYDRTNMVQNVEIPMLGVGFAQTLTVAKPLCNASGTPGAGCNAAIGTTTDPGASSFRAGVDGAIPLPAFAPTPNPQGGVIPGINGEQVSFQLDPSNKVGRSLTADFTLQRQLTSHMLLELGWSGNFGRDLPEGINYNNAPINFLDTVSGQTFAQAYDAIGAQLRQGTAPGAVAVQPWFEHLVPGGTDAFVGKFSSLFNSASVSNLFQDIDNLRLANSLPTFDNQQVGTLFQRTHQGLSNYQAFIATLRMNPTHGLNFDLNYTRSKLLSNGLGDQDSAGFFADSYNPFTTYGYDSSDRTNTFNATYSYDLPHLGGTGFMNKLTAGWYHSGVFTYASGAPLTVSEGGQVYGGGNLGLTNGAAAIFTGNANQLTSQIGVYANNSTATIANRGNTSAGGLGLNIFPDPAAAFNAFRTIQLSSDGRSGNANPLRGFGSWNLNGALGKSTQLTEKTNLIYTLQVFNVFNHPFWNTPNLGLFGSSPASFGVLTSKSGNRTMEMGLRIEF